MTASSVRLRTDRSDTEAMNSLPTLGNRELTSQLFFEESEQLWHKSKGLEHKERFKEQRASSAGTVHQIKTTVSAVLRNSGQITNAGHCGA